MPLQDNKTGDVLISELAAGFIQHAESRNMDKADVGHFKTTIGYLVEVYGGLSVNEFSPKKLKIVRDQMVKAGTLSRPMINKYVGKIRTIFSWGIAEEVINPNIEHSLRALKALRKGEQGTIDRPPRKNVSDHVVERTLPFLSPTVSAMVQLQRMAGMRPSEIFCMRVGDIDRSRGNGLWYYMPGSYKTERYVGAIEFPFGEAEQKLIAPYLEGKKPSDSVFSPRQAVQERRDRERAERKSKRTPSQAERDRQRAKNPADRMGDFYDKSSYWRAVQHGIKKGNQHLPDEEQIPHWSPYQLRHLTHTPLSEPKDEIAKQKWSEKVEALKAQALAEFYKSFDSEVLKELQSVAHYLVIGIDSDVTPNSKDIRIQFVLVYDLHNEMPLHWTGKTYPQPKERDCLIKMPIDTHFIQDRIGGKKLAVFGCHDLSIFNPRHQRHFSPFDDERRNVKHKDKTAAGKIKCEFIDATLDFNPDIMLQLPHSEGTWAAKWTTLNKWLQRKKGKELQHFATGLKINSKMKYSLSGTQRGDVMNFVNGQWIK